MYCGRDDRCNSYIKLFEPDTDRRRSNYECQLSSTIISSTAQLTYSPNIDSYEKGSGIQPVNIDLICHILMIQHILILINTNI